MEAGNLEQAVQRLKQSVEVAPHCKPLELLGECLLKLRRRLEAIVPLAAAMALNNQMGQLAKRQMVDFPVSDGAAGLQVGLPLGEIRFMTSSTSTRKVVVSIALTLATAGFIPARAAAHSCGPNDVVPWWPRFNANDGANTLTAAERATVEAQLTAVEALVRKSPYATPRGFAVQPWFSIHEIKNRTQLYSYGFAVVTKNRCNKYDEGQGHLVVDFNPDPIAWSLGDRPHIDERGEALYMERPRREAILGSIATFGGFHEDITNTSALFLLFTTANESPILPVSREEYLRYKIFVHEGKDQEKLRALTARFSKTPYERWVEEAPQRKIRNEELFALIAKISPAKAAQTRADMEKLEQTEGEQLKRADAFEREKQAKDLALYKSIGDGYRTQISVMSAQERSSPALLVDSDLVPQAPRTLTGLFARIQRSIVPETLRSSRSASAKTHFRHLFRANKG